MMGDYEIKSVYVFFTGFFQNWSKLTGIEKVWRECRHYSSKSNWIFPPLPWDVPTKDIARLIVRNINKETKIIIVGYSWGIGEAAIKLTEELNNFGYSVDTIISCDGIKRPLLPKWLNWINYLISFAMALTRNLKIVIPENVHKVIYLSQEEDNFVRGHRFVAKNPSTEMFGPIKVNTDHHRIDDSKEFKNIVLDSIKNI